MQEGIRTNKFRPLLARVRPSPDLESGLKELSKSRRRDAREEIK